jgi:hypothetical protein
MPHGKQARLVAELAAELERQWRANHAEHCDIEWPHPEGSRCRWPRPAILDLVQACEDAFGLGDDGPKIG